MKPDSMTFLAAGASPHRNIGQMSWFDGVYRRAAEMGPESVLWARREITRLHGTDYEAWPVCCARGNQLLNALHGRGHSGTSRTRCGVYRIEQDWFGFRDNALREIAIDWCEEHQIQWK
jgi:hypothetical protein